MMQDNLVVVTGGSKGIGKAVVEIFAKQGYSVATCARNEEELLKLKEELEEAYEGKIFTCVADLSKQTRVQDFLDFVKMIGKPISILVNNTGAFRPGQIQSEEEGTLEFLMNTNVHSAYHITRGLLPLIKKNKSGYIFNICSTASVTAYTNGGSYCISKFALYGFSKVLREELKEDNIKVTAVLPGATLTPSWDGMDIPEDRFIRANDIAQLIWNATQLSDGAVIEDLLIRPQLGDL